MAIWGELVFYTLHEPQNPEEWILQLCRLSGAQSIEWVSYLEEEERWFKTTEEWERILEDLEFGEDEADKVETIIVVSSFPKLAENISIEEVAKFYNCKECLHISIGICPLSYKVYEATQKIPEELWKTELYQFIPGCQGMFIEIGHHDLFLLTSDPSGYGEEYGPMFIIRNVFCSVHFSSYGFPTDIKRYEEIVFSLPEIQKIKKELESILGSVWGSLLINE
ncbi:hypothetical protein [Fervidibacter sp.]|jgi:hypothetical protein